MSHNLECEGIELAQTPTHITRLCLHGDPSPQQILERYLIWLESCNFQDRECVKEHVKRLRLKKASNLRFYST